MEGSVSGELVGCAFSDGFIVVGCERSSDEPKLAISCSVNLAASAPPSPFFF